jgi:hypothetical protein
MSRSLSSVLLKGLGVVVVLFLVMSVISTILSIVLGFVAAAVSLIVTVTVLFVLVLAAFGLVSLVGDGESTGNADWQLSEPRGKPRESGRADGWRQWLPSSRDGSGRTDSGGVRSDDRDPEQRLRERYVAGEIDEAEFERKMGLLLGSNDTEKRLDERDMGNRRGSNRDRLWER